MSAPYCVYCDESQMRPALWGGLVPIWRCEACAAWELRQEEEPTMIASDFGLSTYEQGPLPVQIRCADCGTELTAARDAVQVASEDARGATTTWWICAPCAEEAPGEQSA